MLLSALLLFAIPSHAGECQALYEAEARELIDASYATLQGEEPDLPEHDRLMRQVATRLACADFEVGATLWARYLVSMAVRNYYGGADWQRPLTTALRIHPDIDLPVRKGHPLRDFEPAPPPTDRGPLPEGVTLRLDGHPLQTYRPLDALHLLQRYSGDDLQTAVVTGPSEIPQAFLTKPRLPSAVRRVKRAKAIHTWGTVGSGALVLTGATLMVVTNRTYKSYSVQHDDASDLEELQASGKTTQNLGNGLFIAGATGAALVWTVPW